MGKAKEFPANTYTVQGAQATFPELARRAAAGEVIIVRRYNKIICQITARTEADGEVETGTDKKLEEPVAARKGFHREKATPGPKRRVR